MREFERTLVHDLRQRISTEPNLLQIVVGPRQVGKSTALYQLQKKWKGTSHFASADLPSPPDAYWIQSQWELARQITKKKKTLLILDEVQKIPRWAEVVKALVDEDRRKPTKLRVILLGSSALTIQAGSGESLAGRFELHYCPHWSWEECREAFGWDLDSWIYYGGYPGAAPLIKNSSRWSKYILDSLIEPVLSRDVLQMTRVDKPALLRQLFALATHGPAEILSYNKMLGQLHDAGNTTTLAHYLTILSQAYLVSGLPLWTGGIKRLRASSPKLVIWNNALCTASSSTTLLELRKRPDLWGRLVENAVGAHLLNHFPSGDHVYYWREGTDEVDYVLQRGKTVVAFEVKTGRPRSLRGLQLFQKAHPQAKCLVVGSGGIPLEDFFLTSPENWLS